MVKNMALIFYENILYSDGKSTLHGLTMLHSLKFFAELKITQEELEHQGKSLDQKEDFSIKHALKDVIYVIRRGISNSLMYDY